MCSTVKKRGPSSITGHGHREDTITQAKWMGDVLKVRKQGRICGLGLTPVRGWRDKEVAQEILWAGIKVVSQVRSPKVTMSPGIIAATREGV